ncbi:MAG: tRNA (adenosine(37)-N6)-threonylcarbamoyltransferase complex ATPase subunit type 1 TsaE [Micropruina sp.]|uniref:tRNA (adenosine(37)-N6)-threonylcarbamoyltransferase complex ATPase subunit type 1 TsaE n=1 Tax=Micropruina sp. TaxID=2737536 RepID=UPI0039E279CD
MSAPSTAAVVAEAGLPDGGQLRILRVDASRAADVLRVVHAAFAARPPVDPPAAALSDTEQTIAEKLAGGFGVLGELDGEPAAALIVALDGDQATITRVAVHPDHQHRGIASALVLCAMDLLAARGTRTLGLGVRTEFPGLGRWWRRHGFVRVGERPPLELLQRSLPVLVEAPTADAMRDLGERLAGLLRPGDVIIATGDLGAGKTTLTQGIGAGLQVAGPVISPTFVLSRVHRSSTGGPALVHVDAYRLGSFDELEDLDLEASLADAVTLIEWGGGIAEGLADDRLEIDIRRGLDPDDETRLVFLAGVGPRWADGQLEELR